MTGISKTTFNHCSQDDKLAILFDIQTLNGEKINAIWQHLRTQCPAQIEKCDARLDIIERGMDKLEAPARAQTAVATAGATGIIAAVLAILKYFGISI